MLLWLCRKSCPSSPLSFVLCDLYFCLHTWCLCACVFEYMTCVCVCIIVYLVYSLSCSRCYYNAPPRLQPAGGRERIMTMLVFTTIRMTITMMSLVVCLHILRCLLFWPCECWCIYEIYFLWFGITPSVRPTWSHPRPPPDGPSMAEASQPRMLARHTRVMLRIHAPAPVW